jgi:hypothetical protein
MRIFRKGMLVHLFLRNKNSEFIYKKSITLFLLRRLDVNILVFRRHGENIHLRVIMLG